MRNKDIKKSFKKVKRGLNKEIWINRHYHRWKYIDRYRVTELKTLYNVLYSVLNSSIIETGA